MVVLLPSHTTLYFPGVGLITFAKHSQPRGRRPGCGTPLPPSRNTKPTFLRGGGGGGIFAHSVSLGLSLVLHRSDAVTDAWLGAKLAL